MEKGVLRNFTKFTGKQLYQSLFLIKLQAFILKKTLARVFSCEFYEISKNNFFTEHLWTTASVYKLWRKPYVCSIYVLYRGCNEVTIMGVIHILFYCADNDFEQTFTHWHKPN